jgi:hypothetical protein
MPHRDGRSGKRTSYSLIEEIGWFYRNITGPSFRNHCGLSGIPSGTALNSITPSMELAAVGDIMDLRGRDLSVSEGVIAAFRSSAYLLGNFEGTITSAPRYLLRQKHLPSIIEQLEKYNPPPRTVLSVANNHAGDYGRDIFAASHGLLEAKGYIVIGTREKPFVDLSTDLRIIAATAWSNKRCPYISYLHDSYRHIRTGAFNLLYLHWGYEMEFFPRRTQVDEAKELLTLFDALIGHHPHTTQPVSVFESNQAAKPAAFSLGNFSAGLPWDTYHRGIILTLQIGRMRNGTAAAGELRWEPTRCTGQTSGRAMVGLAAEKVR